MMFNDRNTSNIMEDNMIIFDLDDVLCDTSHRRHFIDVDIAIKKGIAYEDVYCNIGGIQSNGYFLEDDPDRRWKPDYAAYDNACDGDEVIEAGKEAMMALMYHPYKRDVQIWTSRCESLRDKTLNWLDGQVFFNDESLEYISRMLKMRPVGNIEPAWKLKEQWLDECKSKIDFVFDSDPESIAMYRRRGIFVLDCRQEV